MQSFRYCFVKYRLNLVVSLIVVILVFPPVVMRASLNKQEKQLLESWHWLKRRDQLIQVGSVTLNAWEIEQLDHPS